ncbi:MAG: 4Fe-4S binding protein [Bacteroidales bacterium]|nr:4Fe-4S binding protein [Bacteroidales bacterium]
MSKPHSLLRRMRIVLASLFFVLITLLFLDFTGTLQAWFGWMAKIQFLPAVLALNVGVVIALILVTLLLGRVYCSIICPLGVLQDIFAYFGRKQKKNRYSYSPAKKWLRYGVLAVFVVVLVAGLASLAALIAPYSAYGRIAQNLFAPLYQWGNNALAYFAERCDSYAFYRTEVWIRSVSTFVVAFLTLVILGFMAWRNGRTYCNTICPVGTILGCLSRFSLLRPVINTDKCNGCGRCSKNCKAACIDSPNHSIDYSRCVTCLDCLDACKQGAIEYRLRTSTQTTAPQNSRRRFLAVSAAFTTSAVLKAQHDKVDGGLAVILDKEKPNRNTPIVPPGSQSLRHLSQHCTGCQLCVAACPNGVLRPSSRLENLLQPECSYERGYCRPECTRCSEVCPTGAIQHIDRAEKSAIQVGHAVWVKANCLPLTEGVHCGNCARRCPTGAIKMVLSDPNNPESARIPSINTERCIGCGACENLCPARPFSAIYVEGNDRHRLV